MPIKPFEKEKDPIFFDPVLSTYVTFNKIFLFPEAQNVIESFSLVLFFSILKEFTRFITSKYLYY